MRIFFWGGGGVTQLLWKIHTHEIVYKLFVIRRIFPQFFDYEILGNDCCVSCIFSTFIVLIW